MKPTIAALVLTTASLDAVIGSAIVSASPELAAFNADRKNNGEAYDIATVLSGSERAEKDQTENQRRDDYDNSDEDGSSDSDSDSDENDYGDADTVPYHQGGSYSSNATVSTPPSASSASGAVNWLIDTINGASRVLKHLSDSLSNGASSPGLDTADAVITGISVELEVLASALSRTANADGNTRFIHVVASALGPIVTEAAQSANEAAQQYEQNPDQSNTNFSHVDRVNVLQTYVDSLKSLSEAAQSFNVDTSALDGAISRISNIIQSLSN